MLLTLQDGFSPMNDTEAATKDATRVRLTWEEVSPVWSGGGSTRPERKRYAWKSIHPAVREKRTGLESAGSVAIRLSSAWLSRPIALRHGRTCEARSSKAGLAARTRQ